MQKITALLIYLMLTVTAFGQKHKDKPGDETSTIQSTQVVPQDSIYMRMYRNSLKFGDARTAIQAVYGMMALHPDSAKYVDSLAILYYVSGSYGQALATGKQAYTRNPSSMKFLEIIASSEQKLGMAKEAIDHYDKLFKTTQKLFYAYQEAVLEYSIQRYGECMGNLDFLIQSKEAATEKIQIPNSNTTLQEVPLKAAALNLEGIVYEEQKDNVKAKENFKKALDISPDFVLAKSNLENLDKDKTEKAEKAK